MKNKLESLQMTLQELTEEVGAYAVGSWRYTSKITLQCTTEGLDSFMKKHDLEYTEVIKNAYLSEGIISDQCIYETDTFKLLTFKEQ